MKRGTRNILNLSFSGLCSFSIVLAAAALVILLTPIAIKGTGAFVFRGTVEFRRVMLDQFGRGNVPALQRELEQVREARAPIFSMLREHRTFILDGETSPTRLLAKLNERKNANRDARRDNRSAKREAERNLRNAESALQAADETGRDEWMAARDRLQQQVRELAEEEIRLDQEQIQIREREDELKTRERELKIEFAEFEELEKEIRHLFGPFPGEREPQLPRFRYGIIRWDRARIQIQKIIHKTVYVQVQEDAMMEKRLVPRVEDFRGTPVEPLFSYLETHTRDVMAPRWTFYWRFLFDESKDSHFFGGIWPEILGTFYLTIGAILFAVPIGVISAIYLVEYAGDGRIIGLLRTFVSTLAGVPSIVFGLFGLAFFIKTVGVSPSKSVLAGSMTLAILILPVVIRASEEALRAVPRTYKEAALSLGAGKWRTIVTVILPAALPGILTGIVISMGRAAGETAPIIFTAAVSVGRPLRIWETLTNPTPALPWNIYNLATEHQAVEQIRHVQYGMVLTLVTLVLLLNGTALILRAKISRKLRG